MTILEVYLWGVLVTWIIVSPEDPSADGNVAGLISLFWFVALPILVWSVLKHRVIDRLVSRFSPCVRGR